MKAFAPVYLPGWAPDRRTLRFYEAAGACVNPAYRAMVGVTEGRIVAP